MQKFFSFKTLFYRLPDEIDARFAGAEGVLVRTDLPENLHGSPLQCFSPSGKIESALPIHF